MVILPWLYHEDVKAPGLNLGHSLMGALPAFHLAGEPGPYRPLKQSEGTLWKKRVVPEHFL